LSSFLVSEFANCCWDGKYQSVANLGRIEKNTSPHCSMLWIVHTMVPKFITSALSRCLKMWVVSCKSASFS
jgi:hypothetical protein